MCDVFSGHIVHDKESKDYGKVIYKSGIHHEKDRESIDPSLKITAWETVNPMDLSDFKFTHSYGNLTPKEEKELMQLLKDWAKHQTVKELSKAFLTICVDGKQNDDYTIGNMSISCMKNNVSMITDVNELTLIAGRWSTQTARDGSTQTAGHGSTQIAGYESTQTAGYESIQTARDGSTQRAGYESTQTAGHGSTQRAEGKSTQTAGYESTQTARDGSTQTAGRWSTQTAGGGSIQIAGHESTQTAGHKSIQRAGHKSTQRAEGGSIQRAGYESTQTAGHKSIQTARDGSTQRAGYESTQTAGYGSTQIIYGYTSYIILDGKNVTLLQIGADKTYILKHNDLFAQGYKVGDKFKVINGQASIIK